MKSKGVLISMYQNFAKMRSILFLSLVVIYVTSEELCDSCVENAYMYLTSGDLCWGDAFTLELEFPHINFKNKGIHIFRFKG